MSSSNYAILDSSNSVIQIVNIDDSLANSVMIINPPSNVTMGWIYNGSIFAPPSQANNICADVDSLYSQIIAAGYPIGNNVANGTMTGQILQLDGQENKTDWLTAQMLCMIAIQNGQGNVVAFSVRPLSNQSFTISFNDGLTMLTDMATWGYEVMQYSWVLKNQILAATDPTTINIVAGWPGNNFL